MFCPWLLPVFLQLINIKWQALFQLVIPVLMFCLTEQFTCNKGSECVMKPLKPWNKVNPFRHFSSGIFFHSDGKLLVHFCYWKFNLDSISLRCVPSNSTLYHLKRITCVCLSLGTLRSPAIKSDSVYCPALKYSVL